jgi:hypothetical protein
VATLLLTTSLIAPTLPEGLELPEPYTLLVPVSHALTPISLNLKSTFWPTVYAPPRKGEAEDWSRGKARWGWEVVQLLLEAADDAKARGEVSFSKHLDSTSLLNFRASCQSLHIFPLHTEAMIKNRRPQLSQPVTPEDPALTHSDTQ